MPEKKGLIEVALLGCLSQMLRTAVQGVVWGALRKSKRIDVQRGDLGALAPSQNLKKFREEIADPSWRFNPPSNRA